MRSLHSAVKGVAGRTLGRMRLAQKLMLAFTAVLAVTVFLFAWQLVGVANRSTEQAYIKDTQQLLKDSKFDIERRIDLCYRVAGSVSSDYDIISYLRNWDNSDTTGIFDFSMSLRKKFEQVLLLSPDVYQFRIFATNNKFPEIGSLVYSIDRLPQKDVLREHLAAVRSGYWVLDHEEDNFIPSILVHKRVVSLYTSLQYTQGRSLGIAEVAIPTETFFRQFFSQPENTNRLACVLDGSGTIIYNGQNAFMSRHAMSRESLEALINTADLRNEAGIVPVTVGNTRMNLVYDAVDDLGCTLCYIITNDNITSGFARTTLLIILESILALAVLSVLVYFLTGVIFKKMKQIIATMRRVEEGQLDIRADISGQDEMSEMARHFNRMLQRIEELIIEVIQKQEAKKNADIRALFSQINSHFIVNMLEDIRMLAEAEGRLDIADAITSLGNLLRYSLKWSNELVPLKDEIDYIRNYVMLMNLRYDFTIKLEVDLSDEWMGYKVLKMSLQPLVENAVFHGIQPLERDGVITIRAGAANGYAAIEISDDGAGIDGERLMAVRECLVAAGSCDVQNGKGSGIALRNVDERIKLVFGEAYGIEIDSEKNAWTRVTVKLPE